MRPDIAARVFRMKLRALLNDVCENGVIGRVVDRLYLVEFQKRGLQNAHIICISAGEDAPRSTGAYDVIVIASLPWRESNPGLWHTVTTPTMRGPFGTLDPKCPRIVDGVCSKGYRKRLRGDTAYVDGFPEYKRPGDGRSVLKQGILNRTHRGSPQKPWLRANYDARINAEVCSTTAEVKYLYKYVCKGPGREIGEVGGWSKNVYRRALFPCVRRFMGDIRFRTAWRNPICLSAPRLHRRRDCRPFPRLGHNC